MTKLLKALNMVRKRRENTIFCVTFSEEKQYIGFGQERQFTDGKSCTILRLAYSRSGSTRAEGAETEKGNPFGFPFSGAREET